MIDVKHLIDNPDRYKGELKKRNHPSTDIVDTIISLYSEWKSVRIEYEELRQKQNSFNDSIGTLSADQKPSAIAQMKGISEQAKDKESVAKRIKSELDELVVKIPSLTWDGIPLGKDDSENVVSKVFGTKPLYDFEPKPYWELPVYRAFVDQEAGAKAMGARGFYMKGDMALFQRALFDYVLDEILKEGFELMYVPLMLNDTVLRGTGHIPDFDGQQYEVVLDDNRSYYLVGSSEPSIMGYYLNSTIPSLQKPILNTCWSSCFRKEAGSYGKDQQGILRVHQFEKIEMVAIATQEDAEELFEKFNSIEQHLYSGLEIHYQAVEVCSGDIPSKHRRQVDYEAWFPSQSRFREIGSNGNASDYQNRGLGITYSDDKGKKSIPWGLNCTAVTFRTGLAILEQNQQEDGSVVLPKVIAERMRKTKL